MTEPFQDPADIVAPLMVPVTLRVLLILVLPVAAPRFRVVAEVNRLATEVLVVILPPERNKLPEVSMEAILVVP